VAARSGDGGPAAAASLNAPHGIDMDDVGTLYVADTLNNIVRTVRDGMIKTVAGTGSFGTTGRSGGPALSATLAVPFAVAVDRNSGDLYIVEGSQAVLRVTALS
jgi:serine/threonine-protein kinase